MWGFHPDDSLGDRITKFKLIISMRVSVGSCSGLMHTAHTNCSLIQKERAQYGPIASTARTAGLETMCGQMREHSLQQNPTDCLDPSAHRGTSVLPSFQKEHMSRYSF